MKKLTIIKLRSLLNHPLSRWIHYYNSSTYTLNSFKQSEVLETYLKIDPKKTVLLKDLKELEVNLLLSLTFHPSYSLVVLDTLDIFNLHNNLLVSKEDFLALING